MSATFTGEIQMDIRCERDASARCVGAAFFTGNSTAACEWAALDSGWGLSGLDHFEVDTCPRCARELRV